MKKTAIVLFFIAVVLTSTAAISFSHAAGTATISVDPATQQFPSAHVGDTIKVNVVVSNVQNLWAWDLPDIKFNPSMLSLSDVTEGPFLQQAGNTLFITTLSSTSAISEGDLPDTSCTLMVDTGVSGSGVMATLTFKVLATGNSIILCSKPTLLDPNQIAPSGQTTGVYGQIPSGILNSLISVGSPSSSISTSSPTNSPTSSSAPMPTYSAGTSYTPSPTQSSPASSPISTPATTQTPAHTASPSASSETSSSPDPTISPLPEFPTWIVLISLVVATASLLVYTQRNKLIKK